MHTMAAACLFLAQERTPDVERMKDFFDGLLMNNAFSSHIKIVSDAFFALLTIR